MSPQKRMKLPLHCWGSLNCVIAALACASGRPSPSPDPKTVPAISLTVPDSIDGFRFAEREAFDDPALGHRLRYVGPDSMYTDVFVYPGPVLGKPCDSSTAVTAVEAQIAGFRESFPAMIERHYVDSITITRDERVADQGGVPWCVGRHLTLGVIRDGTPQRSDYYLYVVSGYFVKVRITYPVTSGRVTLADGFIRALFTQLHPN